MAVPEKARYLHQDAFKRFSSGNRSLKCLSEYMEERARVEMNYSVALEQLAARWNRKLADTLDFEYLEFRNVLRETFNEPTDKAPLHNKVANRILNEATMLKKHYKDTFKREAQSATMAKYAEATEKQMKLEERVQKAKKKYHRKKHALEHVQKAIAEFPFRSESSSKHQDLEEKRAELSRQATDTYLRYESRLRVDTMNRQEFIRDMRECEAAYNDHELQRLLAVCDRIGDMLKDLAMLDGSERDPSKERLAKLKSMVQGFSVTDAVNKYSDLFAKEHTFPKFEDYRSHGEVDKAGQATVDDTSDVDLAAPDSRELVLSTARTQRDSDTHLQRPTTSPTPVMAWEPPGSDEGSEEEDRGLRRHGDTDREVLTTSTVDVTRLSDVRVVAIRAHWSRQLTELSYEIGQVIKQKLPANEEGMAYGWIRPNNYSKRRYGSYPANSVRLMAKKQKKKQ
ncbi:protein kinase C and casein kinase substrate in neurons protein 2-like [Haliotis rufescens]|uniref:protein kinase C and casein kinase substrate in neurons protein 2-like n=1 Tax=Haliotis rufescens TaxID=6454 RepID=UPI00201E9058|nr:protein kinase C and casein kinase substrate in neurons protein 2-like [Haliotis rufescens]